MSRQPRYAVQRRARPTLPWRTVLRTDSRDTADARFLAHITMIRAGGSVRLIDDWGPQVLAMHPALVHDALA